MKISVLLDVKKDSQVQVCLDLLNRATKVRESEISLEIIRNDESLPRTKFWNSAFEKIAPDSKFILLLNSEIWMTTNSLNRMLDVLEKDELTGAVGTYQNVSQHGKQTALPNYKDLGGLQEAVDKFEANHAKSRLHIFLEGECMLVRKSALDKIVFLDGNFANEKFTHAVFDGIDLSLKIWLAGFKLQLAPTFVHWQRLHAPTVEQFYEDEQLFNDTWGFKISYTTVSRIELLGMIPDLARDDLEILEIGCAAGGTLCEIKNRNPKAKLHGIEINPNSAKISSCFARVENVDVEKFAPEHWHDKFDYIICGDVIEHLIDPWSAVKNIRTMLKPGGHLLASIPNISNIDILFDLLHGHWNYVDAGILDRTHLRFFTFESISKMFMEANLYGVIVPKELVKTDETRRFAQELSARFNVPLNTFTTFQWIIDVKKN